MKRPLSILILVNICLFAICAMAADKVVVVPLGSGKVPKELVPLAHAEINTAAGVISSTGHYGISSITYNGAGDVTVILNSSWNGYPTVLTGMFGSGGHTVSYGAYKNSDSIRFYIRNVTTGALENGYFSFLVFGEKQ